MLGSFRDDTFRTARLTFRPCCAADLDELHHLWSHSDVRRFLFDDRTISREETLSFIRSSETAFATQGYGIWLFCEIGSSELAGFAGLLESSLGPPRLIYGTRAGRWRRGYATEAGRGVLRHVFDVVGLQRVAADVDEPNAASVRVLERLRMRRIGAGIVDGKPLLYYELNRDSWNSEEGGRGF